MEMIDIDQERRIEEDFFYNDRAEWNRASKLCRVLERMDASCDAAFAVFGSAAPNLTEDFDTYTWFLSAITPERLEAALPQINYVRAFFEQEWRKATGKRARMLARAVCDCDAAIAAVRTRLAELEPVMKEQNALLQQFEQLITQLEERTKTCRTN